MATTVFRLEVLADTSDHRRQVNDVLQAATDYHLLVGGHAPTASHVDEFFTSVPPGFILADMAPLGFFIGAQMVGVGGVLRGWDRYDALRVGVITTNDGALVFWRKVGFVDTGEIKPRYGHYLGDVVILEKPLRTIS